MNFASRLAAVALAALLVGCSLPALAQSGPQQSDLPPPQRAPGPDSYGPDELVSFGQRFFGDFFASLPNGAAGCGFSPFGPIPVVC